MSISPSISPNISLSKLLRLCPLFLLITICVTSCAPQTPFALARGNTPLPMPTNEQAVTEIPLKGPVSRRRAQLSGLAWYHDNLILLPQYPDRFQNQIFYLTKQEITSILRGDSSEPLRPHPIPLVMGDLLTRLPGFQGFEAIAIDGERAFLTVEAETAGQMIGYLVTGELQPDLSEIRLTSDLISNIAPQTHLKNVSDESILLAGDHIVTIYEVNGSLINLSPVAHLFSAGALQFAGTIAFPHIDYRITDATSLDTDNRFWAINTFSLSNTPLSLGSDTLTVTDWMSSTQRASQTVERLVEFEYSLSGIVRTDTPPVQLQLLDGAARNWEGIVRFESEEFSGFLLVTDRQPKTMLAFVPHVFE